MSLFFRDLANLNRQMNQMMSLMAEDYMDMDDLGALKGSEQQMIKSDDQSKQGKGSQGGQMTKKEDKSDNQGGLMGLFQPLGLTTKLPVPKMHCSVDVAQTDKAYQVTCEMAGVDKKDIDISADKRTNMLTIKAEKKQELVETEPLKQVTDKSADKGASQQSGPSSPTKGKQGQGQGKKGDQQGQSKQGGQADAGKKEGGDQPRVVRSERVFGKFERSVRLGVDADLDNVKASFENGVLKLEVPRVQKAESSSTKKIQVL